MRTVPPEPAALVAADLRTGAVTPSAVFADLARLLADRDLDNFLGADFFDDDFLPGLAIVGISAIGVHHRERFRGSTGQPAISAEIERSKRAQRRSRNQLLLLVEAVLAARVLDDAVANSLRALARIDDQRGTTAEPEKSVGDILAVEWNRLPLV